MKIESAHQGILFHCLSCNKDLYLAYKNPLYEVSYKADEDDNDNKLEFYRQKRGIVPQDARFNGYCQQCFQRYINISSNRPAIPGYEHFGSGRLEETVNQVRLLTEEFESIKESFLNAYLTPWHQWLQAASLFSVRCLSPRCFDETVGHPDYLQLPKKIRKEKRRIYYTDRCLHSSIHYFIFRDKTVQSLSDEYKHLAKQINNHLDYMRLLCRDKQYYPTFIPSRIKWILKMYCLPTETLYKDKRVSFINSPEDIKDIIELPFYQIGEEDITPYINSITQKVSTIYVRDSRLDTITPLRAFLQRNLFQRK